MKVVIVSGGFDPLHSGHINHFEAASELGDRLIIALNSDEWLVKKRAGLYAFSREVGDNIESADGG